MHTQANTRKTIIDKQSSEKLLGNLLTIKETAAYLRVSSGTVNKLIRNREVGHVKIGSRVLIPTKSINAFLEKHYVPPFDAKAFARSILNGRI
jgi:excisionase family DNA binding protein